MEPTLDGEKLVVEFINSNIGNIIEIAKESVSTLNDTVKTRLKWVYGNYLKNSQ